MSSIWDKALAAILTVALIVIAALILQAFLNPSPAVACEPTPVTANTPTGIAGCYQQGDGIASHYGPGDGVAMNFCTWARRTTSGCGWATIQSHDTGLTVTVRVVDFCDCYTGTANERLVDLQYGVVAALGLDLSRGLYPVTVSLGVAPAEPAGPTTTEPVLLPDTATAAEGEDDVVPYVVGMVTGAIIVAVGIMLGLLIATRMRP